MISMTGYGFSEQHDGDRHLSIEIKSYNSRYLDLYLNMPGFLNPLEAEIRAAVAAVVKRGKVEISVRLREFSAPVTYHVDENAARAAHEALRRIAEATGTAQEVSLRDVVAFEGVLQVDRAVDAAVYRPAVFELLTHVLEQYQESRRREGAALRADIMANLTRVEAASAVFMRNAARMEQIVFETVRAKFQQALGSAVDEARVLTESAALMMRHATNEETVRLTAHVAGFRDVVATNGESVGKKLDFICQEINREVNTVGSKSTIAEVHAAVVDAKDALEMIREQLRNVE